MLKNIAVAAALIIASTAAMAADAPAFYAGADVGTTKGEGDSDRETGYGAFAGYQINQHIAAEVGVRRLVSIDDTVAGFNESGSVNQLSLSAVGTMPLGNGFSAFARLGVNRLNLKATGPGYKTRDFANRGLYGIGVAYNFTPAIAVRAELQKPISDLTSLNVGVSYKF